MKLCNIYIKVHVSYSFNLTNYILYKLQMSIYVITLYLVSFQFHRDLHFYKNFRPSANSNIFLKIHVWTPEVIKYKITNFYLSHANLHKEIELLILRRHVPSQLSCYGKILPVLQHALACHCASEELWGQNYNFSGLLHKTPICNPEKQRSDKLIPVAQLLLFVVRGLDQSIPGDSNLIIRVGM